MIAANIGAMSPATLFRKLATPVPAPRTGAGLLRNLVSNLSLAGKEGRKEMTTHNNSGVKAYKTPYMMFCTNASTHEKASIDVSEVP